MEADRSLPETLLLSQYKIALVWEKSELVTVLRSANPYPALILTLCLPQKTKPVLSKVPTRLPK